MRYAVSYLVLIWLVFALGIHSYGIYPHDLHRLPYIVLAPWQHVDSAHIIANSIPGAVLAFVVRHDFWRVTLIGVILGGLGTWALGVPGTVIIGASGLIYTWLLFVLTRGFFNRNVWQLCVAALVFIIYGGLLWGVLPSDPHVSWQGHLCGAIAGIVAAARGRKESTHV